MVSGLIQSEHKPVCGRQAGSLHQGTISGCPVSVGKLSPFCPLPSLGTDVGLQACCRGPLRCCPGGVAERAFPNLSNTLYSCPTVSRAPSSSWCTTPSGPWRSCAQLLRPTFPRTMWPGRASSGRATGQHSPAVCCQSCGPIRRGRAAAARLEAHPRKVL